MNLRPLDSIVSSAERMTDEEFDDLMHDLKVVANREREKRVRSFSRKDFQIGVRVTEEEYEYVKKQAEQLQVSMSAVIRFMMLKCIKDIQL